MLRSPCIKRIGVKDVQVLSLRRERLDTSVDGALYDEVDPLSVQAGALVGVRGTTNRCRGGGPSPSVCCCTGAIVESTSGRGRRIPIVRIPPVLVLPAIGPAGALPFPVPASFPARRALPLRTGVSPPVIGTHVMVIHRITSIGAASIDTIPFGHELMALGPLRAVPVLFPVGVVATRAIPNVERLSRLGGNRLFQQNLGGREGREKPIEHGPCWRRTVQLLNEGRNRWRDLVAQCPVDLPDGRALLRAVLARAPRRCQFLLYVIELLPPRADAGSVFIQLGLEGGTLLFKHPLMLHERRPRLRLQANRSVEFGLSAREAHGCWGGVFRAAPTLFCSIPRVAGRTHRGVAVADPLLLEALDQGDLPMPQLVQRLGAEWLVSVAVSRRADGASAALAIGGI